MNLEILKEIYRRHQKFKGEVIITRRENDKFGLTEWQMRKELRELRKKGLVCVDKRFCGEVRFTNIYKITDELMAYIKEQLKDLKESFDIVKFNLNTPVERVKQMLGLNGNGKNFVISKDSESKYTFNTDYKIITWWSKKNKNEYKHFNLFNGLKEIFGLNTYSLIKDII